MAFVRGGGIVGAGGGGNAGNVSVDTSNFDGNLSPADDTVQEALDTIDNLPTTAPPASSVGTDTSNFDGYLSAADDTVQKALDTLDDHIPVAIGRVMVWDPDLPTARDGNVYKNIEDIATDASAIPGFVTIQFEPTVTNFYINNNVDFGTDALIWGTFQDSLAQNVYIAAGKTIAGVSEFAGNIQVVHQGGGPAFDLSAKFIRFRRKAGLFSFSGPAIGGYSPASFATIELDEGRMASFSGPLIALTGSIYLTIDMFNSSSIIGNDYVSGTVDNTVKFTTDFAVLPALPSFTGTLLKSYRAPALLAVSPGTQALGASDQIDYLYPLQSGVMRISGDSGPSVLTSTPTIRDIGTDNYQLTLIGTDSTNTVTLQDELTLPGTKLKLRTPTFTLGKGDYIQLARNTADDVWYEVGRSSLTVDGHNTSHEDGGSDEISVDGLSGTLADPQTPAAHATSHDPPSGADQLDWLEVAKALDPTLEQWVTAMGIFGG